MKGHGLPPFDDAVGRIWAQIAANAADIGDLFERIAQSFYTKVVRPGDTVIDGGAHMGRHAIPLAQLVGAEGKVLAFEPLPFISARLQQSLVTTGLNQRVRLRPEGFCANSAIDSDDELESADIFGAVRARGCRGLRLR